MPFRTRTTRHALTASLLIAAAATSLSCAVEAATVQWVQVGYASSPSARVAAGIAFDGTTHSTLLFGGADGQSIYGDTWIWNGSWHPRFPASSPAARQGPAIAFDGAAGNVVLFGGSPTVPVGNGTAFGDTWTWDGINWTQQFAPLSPPARTWSTMVYVPATKTVLLFSGTNSPGGDNAYSDTWAWDGVAKTWTELFPEQHPAGRAMNQLVYDPVTHDVVMFGGVTTNLTPLNDTWTWNGFNWTKHLPLTSPAPRNGPALAYDGSLGAVVLFGGAVGQCCSNNLNDTWIWNGVNWAQIYPVNALPPARNSETMAYDPIEKVVLLFGGDTSGPVLSDTWFFTVAR